MILEDGEIICDRCNGEGADPVNFDHEDGAWLWCRKCGGDKKLTWVENVLGKNGLRFEHNDDPGIPGTLGPPGILEKEGMIGGIT